MYRFIIRRQIRAAFRALSRGDAPALLAHMSPDVHHTFPGDHALGGQRRSHEDVAAWFGRLFRLLPELDFTITTLAVDGWPWNTTIGVEWTNTGSLLDGTAYANTGAHILRMGWAKITAFHAYLHDGRAFSDALTRVSAFGLTEADAAPIVTPPVGHPTLTGDHHCRMAAPLDFSEVTAGDPRSLAASVQAAWPSSAAWPPAPKWKPMPDNTDTRPPRTGAEEKATLMGFLDYLREVRSPPRRRGCPSRRSGRRGCRRVRACWAWSSTWPASSGSREADGQLWIAMDYVDGLDASQLLSHRYPAGMPTDDVAYILTAIASALDYAHKQGLLHRDIKPSNIMLTHVDDDGDKRILLADFGIARALGDVSGLTATNMTVGTVAYSAPEQLMGGAMDGRADQYALAATAYHLLTGSPLFPHSNPAVIISRHLNSQPPALADKRPDLADLDPVLSAALAKDPADRFTRCTDFARAFAEQARSRAPASAAPTARAVPRADGSSQTASRATPPTSVVPPPAQAGRASRRWVLPTALVTGTAAVLVAALAWHPWDRQSEPLASPTQSTPPSGLAPSPSSMPAPPPAPPPRQVFSASAIDDLLLSPAEINEIVGTSDVATSEGRGLLKVADTTYGMSDNTEIVTPPACASLLFGAEYFAWGGSGFDEMRNQTLRPDQYASYDNNVPTPSEIEQTVAVFPTVTQAQAFMTTSQDQWERCAGGDVRRRYIESGHTYTIGEVKRQGDLLTVSMAAISGLNGANACQHVLGVRENVVVGARSCLTPAGVTPNGSAQENPAWAGDDGERLATAMLNKVHT